VVGFRNFVGYIVMGVGMLLGNFLYLTGLTLGVPQLPFYTAFGLAIPQLLIILLLVHEPRERAGMTASSASLSSEAE
jgi:hypothetical protein